MNKAQFVELVKNVGDYKTKADAELAVEAFTEAVTIALAKKEDVSLIGFGNFTAVLQRGKSGTVPGTNKTYTTQDKMAPKFRAGKTLKDRVSMGK
ncbi:HU family DNA-binding protein [Sulfurimonas sp.]